MLTILVVIHVVLAIALVTLVLLQRGPGATMGAAFGAGASGTVFGSRGAASFLTRATGVLAFGFFAISLSMAVLAARTGGVADPDDLGLPDTLIQAPEAPDEADPPDDEGEFPAVPDEEAEIDAEEEEFPDIPEDGAEDENGSDIPEGADS